MLHVLHASAPVLVGQQQAPVNVHLLDRSRPDQSLELIHGVILELLLAGLVRIHLRPVALLARAPHGVHPISNSIVLQQADPLHESREILRKRNHVLPKLRKPSAFGGDVRDLHVVQRHEHGFHERGRIEELLQLPARPSRKGVHGIHVVQVRTLRNDPGDVAGLRARLLVADVQVAHPAHAGILPRDEELQRGLVEWRHVVPRSHLDVAQSHARPAVLPQQVHVERLRRRVRRVERRHSLTAPFAAEHVHPRLDLVLRPHGLQLRHVEVYLALRLANRHELQRNHHVLRQKLRDLAFEPSP